MVSHWWLCAPAGGHRHPFIVWRAVPVIPSVCSYIPHQLFQCTQVPSLPFDPRSPPLQEDLLLFALIPHLHSVQINAANSPSSALLLHHPSVSAPMSSLHPRRRSPGSTGCLASAFENQALKNCEHWEAPGITIPLHRNRGSPLKSTALRNTQCHSDSKTTAAKSDLGYGEQFTPPPREHRHMHTKPRCENKLP